MSNRYFLGQDNDSHWYIVPDDKRAQWDAWINMRSSERLSWDAPEYAQAIGGSPGMVTFTEPKL